MNESLAVEIAKKITGWQETSGRYYGELSATEESDVLRSLGINRDDELDYFGTEYRRGQNQVHFFPIFPPKVT